MHNLISQKSPSGTQMCNIITDLLFKLPGLHAALQNLQAGVKQLQSCQIFCSETHTHTQSLCCTATMCIKKTKQRTHTLTCSKLQSSSTPWLHCTHHHHLQYPGTQTNCFGLFCHRTILKRAERLEIKHSICFI